MGSEGRQLPVSAPSEGYFILHYSMNRPALISQNKAAIERFMLPFSLMIFTLGCLAAIVLPSFLLNYCLYIAMPAIAASVLFLDLSRPTHIQISRGGFRMHWLNPVFYYKSPVFRWDQIRSLSYVPEEGSTNSAKFRVTVDVSEFTTESRFLFDMMCLTSSQVSAADEITLNLLETGFFEADQSLFRAEMIKHVPPELISSDLIAREEFGEVPTYTALWLGSLHAKNTIGTILSPGVKLAEGRYEIVSRLASGGQANVYEALQLQLDGHQDETLESQLECALSEVKVEASLSERCVLKEFVLPSRGGSEIQKRAVQNIQREANLLKQLNHMQIVKYRDLFVEGSRAYLVMERIEGVSLRQAIESHEAMSSARVLALARQMCDLLEYLHEQQPPLIHRDFTPENLMLGGDDRLTLIDFNVAYRLESKSTKTVVGKHAYVPPEQFRGKPTTQSDIYAMGATLYYLLTGKDPVPLSKSNPCDIVAGVNKSLSALIARATEPDVSNRFQAVQQFRAVLDACE